MERGVEIMSILILGGAGFIGRNLARAMSDKGVDVLVYDRVPPMGGGRIRYFFGELGDMECLRGVIESEAVDTVVHCVSSLVPSSPLERLELEFSQVIQPSLRLFEHLARLGVRLVFLSSGGAVYGNWKGDPYVESDPLRPINYYGQSKVMMEEFIGLCHRTRGLDYIVLRPSNPFGPGQNIDGIQGVIAVAIGRILRGLPVTVFGDGENVRDYIFIDDCTATIAELLDKGAPNDVYNVCSGYHLSINEIIGLIETISGRKAVIDWQPARPSDSRRIVLNGSKTASLVGGNCLPIEVGMRHFYDYVSRDFK
jgi:UDP-glucose 4-epimerase